LTPAKVCFSIFIKFDVSNKIEMKCKSMANGNYHTQHNYHNHEMLGMSSLRYHSFMYLKECI